MAKTVLFLVPGCECGGVATSFNTLAAFLERHGFIVRVLLNYRTDLASAAIDHRYIAGWAHEKPIGNRLVLRLVNLFNLLTNYRFYFFGVPKIKHDIFVVYQTGAHSFWWRYTKKRRIGWFHIMAPERSGMWRETLWTRSIRSNLARFDQLVAITQAVSDSYRERYALSTPPAVVPLKLMVSEIECRAEEPQVDIQRASEMNIIYVGRLSPEKGILRLLRIVQQLLREGYSFHMWFVGDGPLKEFCSRVAADSRNIHILGKKANPYPYMKAADLLVLPSHREGMGLVLWEALLLGTPVIATDAGGVRWALRDGAWGRVVDNSDDALLIALREILSQQEKPPRRDLRSALCEQCAKADHMLLQLFFEGADR